MAQIREQAASFVRPMPERLAGAPISWGACEVPGWGRMPDANTVLAEMAQLGLHATELGPPGFLPAEPAALSARLGRHGLRFVGAFTPLALHDPDLEATAREARQAIDLLAGAGGEVLVVAAVQDLAWSTPRPLDDAGWRRLAAHAAEIQALAETEVGWCLDTGHLLIGGTDPAAFAHEHGRRITHVHLKDVDDATAAELRAGRLSLLHATQRGLFVALGRAVPMWQPSCAPWMITGTTGGSCSTGHRDHRRRAGGGPRGVARRRREHRVYQLDSKRRRSIDETTASQSRCAGVGGSRRAAARRVRRQLQELKLGRKWW